MSSSQSEPLFGASVTAMRTSSGLSDDKRRTLFRAWHRGMREMDMLFGPFANIKLEGMSAEEHQAFDQLMSHDDTMLLKWFMSQEPVPDDVKGDMFDRVKRFREEFQPEWANGSRDQHS